MIIFKKKEVLSGISKKSCFFSQKLFNTKQIFIH